MVEFTRKEQFFPCRSNTKLPPPTFGLVVVVLLQRKTCTYDAARKIVDKFMTTGLFEPGWGGSPQTIMQPWKVAYLEALVTYNSFMYLSEIQKALRDKPKLTCSWNSIYPYKLQNSYQFRLNETQGGKGTFGKVYTSEHSSMNSVCAMGKNCWPKKALFCWRDYYSTR